MKSAELLVPEIVFYLECEEHPSRRDFISMPLYTITFEKTPHKEFKPDRVFTTSRQGLRALGRRILIASCLSGEDVRRITERCFFDAITNVDIPGANLRVIMNQVYQIPALVIHERGCAKEITFDKIPHSPDRLLLPVGNDTGDSRRTRLFLERN